uniref:Calponin-homology (CH) domain-containing protein n=1 Tax=Hippocampus comes TaxID=109280 RepID=A0A3Q3D4I6_HIPCM
ATQLNIPPSRLKLALPDDLGTSLMDGVVLCHLANHIRPRSVISIHVPSPAVPKLSMAKCRRNVENFLDACRKIGVPEVRPRGGPQTGVDSFSLSGVTRCGRAAMPPLGCVDAIYRSAFPNRLPQNSELAFIALHRAFQCRVF